MYHCTEYHREFWDAMRGKEVNGYFIDSGRSTQNGSYRLPYESDQRFVAARKKENIFRQISTVVDAAHGDHVIFTYDNEPVAAWLDAKNTGSFFNNAATFGRYKITSHQVGSTIVVPEDFDRDVDFDVEGHVLKEFGRCIGGAEEAAFIGGDGEAAPSGFLNDAAIGHSTEKITYDDVIKLYFSLDKQYRKNGVWLMNDETALKLRTLKDADGNYIWNQSDNTILGKPIYISNYMPGEAAGAKPIAFGDFSYFWIVDRMPFSMRRLTELYVFKQQVGYLGYEYLDAKLIRPDAIHVMQISE